MRERRTIEFWREVRGLVEKGLSLKRASQRFGLSFSHLSQRAAIEGWKLAWRGRPRTMDRPDVTRRLEIAREQAEYDALQAELRQEAEVLVIDVKKAELLAQKVLRQHSVRLKVALSELMVKTLRSCAVAKCDCGIRRRHLVAIKAVGTQIYGWDKEPDIHQLERARSGAINLYERS